MKKFALIGAAGYVAPRHMQAIKETGNNLVAAFDPNDSVGILDRYFPDADFFTEYERFDRHIDKLRRGNNSAVDYVSICSPNYLHDSHIRFALRSGCHAICEKPLVLNPWNIDAMEQQEKETGNRIYTVLQLRLHPTVSALKKMIDSDTGNKKYEVDLTYITPRGKWYLHSWKGDEEKSGGIAANIGIHLFDMLYYLFGKLQENKIHYRDEIKAAGFLEYDQARVRWFLSTDAKDLQFVNNAADNSSYRALSVNGRAIEFSDGFEGLHTQVYRDILEGKGFGLEQNRPAVETSAAIRTGTVLGKTGDYHPLLATIFS